MTSMEKLFGFLDSLCSAYLRVQSSRSPELFEGRGVVIPEAQVTAALAGQQPLEPWPDFDEYLTELEGEINADDSPFAGIVRRLELKGFSLFALLLAYAPEQNRKYERVFGYLQDNIGEKHATLGLAIDLFSMVRSISDGDAFAVCADDNRLSTYLLKGDITGLSRPLVLREAAVIYLSGASNTGSALKRLCSLISPKGEPKPIVRGEEIARCVQFGKNCFGQSAKTGLLALYGSVGSGRRFCLKCLASELKRTVLCVDCEALSALDGSARAELLEETAAHCMLQETVPALINFDFKGFADTERTAFAQEILSYFAGGLPLLALCGEKELKLRISEDFVVFRYELQRHTISEQSAFWSEFSKECRLPLSSEADSLFLANCFTLTPGQIRQVLSSADADCRASGGTQIGREEISAAVRALCRPRLGALTEPMECRFTWDDLLLDDRAMTTLKLLCDRIRYRWRVNEEWGFDRKLPYGKGVSVLLFGPPGTGKTMTAQVLAKEFGLDAYRVDLSRIMDKYIGETEKKLGELFDAAKDSNAILFFDEAEALFSKRTEVSDSKDKYANAETAYLLQRMEQHNGICLLATNNLQNFDKAFKRRITFIVSIEMPDAATRLSLWQKVFPKDVPLSPKLDLALLAERAEMTGSSIKAAAVSAAYIAAARDGEITMDILRGCIVEELKKIGKIVAEYELM